MKKTRLLALVLAVLMLSALFAGCGKEPAASPIAPPTGKSTTAAPEESTTASLPPGPTAKAQPLSDLPEPGGEGTAASSSPEDSTSKPDFGGYFFVDVLATGDVNAAVEKHASTFRNAISNAWGRYSK